MGQPNWQGNQTQKRGEHKYLHEWPAIVVGIDEFRQGVPPSYCY